MVSVEPTLGHTHRRTFQTRHRRPSAPPSSAPPGGDGTYRTLPWMHLAVAASPRFDLGASSTDVTLGQSPPTPDTRRRHGPRHPTPNARCTDPDTSASSRHLQIFSPRGGGGGGREGGERGGGEKRGEGGGGGARRAAKRRNI